MKIVAEHTRKLGTMDAVETEYDIGVKAYRTIAADVEPVPAVLIDNFGRMLDLPLPESTILVMVAVTGFGTGLGALQFDRVGMKDQTGREMYVQRPAISRNEIFDLVQEIVAKNQMQIAIPTGRELRDVSRVKL